MAIGTYLSIITLNVNELNAPTKDTDQMNGYKNNTYLYDGHHQMANTEMRLIIFFAAKNGEALYSQQKQDWEQIVAQIMSFILPN